MESMVCQSVRKDLHQRPPPTSHKQSLSDEDSYQKSGCGCTILTNLTVGFAASIVLHYTALQHQLCIETCVASLKKKMCPELKLAADDDNANLILIFTYRLSVLSINCKTSSPFQPLNQSTSKLNGRKSDSYCNHSL